MYILVTDQIKLPISNKEAKAVCGAFENDGVKMLTIRNQMINKAFIRGIYEYDTYINQEADRLSERNKRRCKKCGRILSVGDRCPCWDGPEFMQPHPLKIQDSKNLIKEKN